MDISIWAEYLKALNKCCDTVKLAAYYTEKTAKHTRQTATEVEIAAQGVALLLYRLES